MAWKDIDERDLATLGLNKLQRKHWHMGVHQVMQAQKEAALDGVNDDPTFRGWLDGWRLSRLYEKMDELGAYVQQDLLDLEPSEVRVQIPPLPLSPTPSVPTRFAHTCTSLRLRVPLCTPLCAGSIDSLACVLSRPSASSRP